ncbi:MAG: sulfite exporter TauE/SafE family protein [Elusimicrobia bacterium]|nr:sulfite exporter TauE/SafE family protein [Elusimicrobiota bacterium]
MQSLVFVLVGLGVGALSGLIGIGGGVFLVPIFVFAFGMTQQQAQGTSLAILVPPIGLLAALQYYRQGHVDVRIAALICAGFFFGGLAGAKLAVGLPNEVLRRVFGCALTLIGLRMAFLK